MKSPTQNNSNEKKKIRPFFKAIERYFVSGLLIILPIGITIFALVKIFNFLDSLLGNLFKDYLKLNIPGLGLLATIILLLLVGLFANNFLGKKITTFVERLLKKTPLVKAIYNPMKEITQNFSGKQSKSFRKVVFLDFPMQGRGSIGFITKESIVIDGTKKDAVFIPTTPNPTNGFLIYANSGEYTELDMSVDEALKTIISLGSISPDILK